jgi:hypothetical protein
MTILGFVSQKTKPVGSHCGIGWMQPDGILASAWPGSHRDGPRPTGVCCMSGWLSREAGGAVRDATGADDALFVRHYLDAWAAEDWPDERHFPDAGRVRQFMAARRASSGLGGFVATHGAGVAGVLGRHPDFAPYPDRTCSVQACPVSAIGS